MYIKCFTAHTHINDVLFPYIFKENIKFAQTAWEGEYAAREGNR